MDMREYKGLQLAATAKITFSNGVWNVPSQSGKGWYKVILKAGEDSCNCEDFGLTAKPCKHIYAARFVRERDHGGNFGEVADDLPPKKKTYKQNWPVYNEAQQTEKSRFQVLLHDLTGGVEDLPRAKTGRPRTSMADMVFAATFKIYSMMGSRRFQTDLDDAYEKGYLSQRLNSMSTCAYLEMEEMTPLLARLIIQSSLPLRAIERHFAPDSTGFSTSTFGRWYDEKYGTTKYGRRWVKAHAICGVKSHIITAVTILDSNAADSPQFHDLVATTAKNFKIEEVSADKGYLSRENLEQVECI
jgi:hypothetical protein